MFSSADSTLPAKPLALDRVNQLVQEALAGIRGAPPVEVVVRPADVGLQVPAGSVGYGVTVRSGDIYVFQSAMRSDMDVFRTVFHELFHRGVRVLVPKGQYVQTMLNLAKGDSRIQQLAVDWKNTEMGQKQKENLQLQGYTGSELTAQYEALADVSEEIKAEGKLGSKPKIMTIRFLANWLAKVADLAGMKKLAQGIRAMTYNEAERFVVSAIDRSGAPVNSGNNGNFDPANPDIAQAGVKARRTSTGTNALSQALELGVAVMREDMALRQRCVGGRGADANAGTDQTMTPALRRGTGTGRMPAEVTPMEHEDMTHQDELKMSTPFSDVAAWEKLIEYQLRSGRFVLRGPPGLWEKLAAQHASITGREMISPPSIPSTPID